MYLRQSKVNFSSVQLGFCSLSALGHSRLQLTICSGEIVDHFCGFVAYAGKLITVGPSAYKITKKLKTLAVVENLS